MKPARFEDFCEVASGKGIGRCEKQGKGMQILFRDVPTAL